MSAPIGIFDALRRLRQRRGGSAPRRPRSRAWKVFLSITAALSIAVVLAALLLLAMSD